MKSLVDDLKKELVTKEDVLSGLAKRNDVIMTAIARMMKKPLVNSPPKK